MTRNDGMRVWAVLLVLVTGTVALFFPVLGFSYVNLEDQLNVINNPHVNAGLSGAWSWAFLSGYGNVWQPLAWLSHALDSQIFRLNPGGHHVVNLILHTLNSALVFMVLRRLTSTFWRSALVAAFFAWHPLHVESVAWVSARPGLLCAFFWLLTVWCYAGYVQKPPGDGSKLRTLYYVSALVLFILALMCSSEAMTLPFVLILLDWWPLGRMTASPEQPSPKRIPTVILDKLPFFALSILIVIVTFLVTPGGRGTDATLHLTYKARMITAITAYFHYLAKVLWPSDLGAISIMVFHNGRGAIILMALVLALVLAVAVWVAKKRPFWIVGYIWFLLTFYPLMDFVQTGGTPMLGHYLDHCAYISSIGLMILVCWEATDLAANWHLGRNALAVICAIVLAACCAASAMQLESWRNEGTLLARITDSKHNAIGHADYAAFLLEHGQLPQAQAECEKAEAIAPGASRFVVLLGEVFLAEGKVDDAVGKFKAALRLDNNSEPARLGLGRTFLAKKDLTNAGGEFKQIVRDDPRNFAAHAWLARTLLVQGKSAEAISEFGASLKLQISQPQVLNELAWLLSTSPNAQNRNGKEAVKLASLACQLTHGEQPALLGTLGAALAETGDFDNAIKVGQKAHDEAAAQGRKVLADEDLKLVTLYKKKMPFRDKQ